MSTTAEHSPTTISVIVASWSGEAALRRCLASLAPQIDSAVQIIVPYRGVTDLGASLSPLHPNVQFLRCAPDATVFQLRSLGMPAATGDIIAHLEDHAAVGELWIQSLREAKRQGHTIFGGAIDNGEPCTAYDWALYFVEYGIYMPPIPGGKTGILSGVNIAYDRSTLLSCAEIWKDVFYETDVNGVLLPKGHTLQMIPSAAVSSQLRMGFAEAMGHLYTGGIHYGSFRGAQKGVAGRLLWLLLSPIVPFVLLARIARLTLARRPDRASKLLIGAPALLALLGAWSLGEAASFFAPKHTSRP
jgi:hypothetical protein